jgi:hypothetical protein
MQVLVVIKKIKATRPRFIMGVLRDNDIINQPRLSSNILSFAWTRSRRILVLRIRNLFGGYQVIFEYVLIDRWAFK